MKASKDDGESMTKGDGWLKLPVGRLESLFRQTASQCAMTMRTDGAFLQCLNPHTPCFQLDPSFFTASRILR
jgi:hypothetical protein